MQTSVPELAEINSEPEHIHKMYGAEPGKNSFGNNCLLARRLTEAGARFIEVTTEYVPFLHWDTHKDGHTTVADLHRQMDLPIATLIRDLEMRGLLDRTAVRERGDHDVDRPAARCHSYP